MYNDKMMQFGKTRSAIRELFEYGNMLAQKIGRENVFDFTLGNPTVPTPEKVNKLAVEKITNDKTIHAYTSAQGLPWVREKIAQANKQNGLPVSAERIYMTCGANAGLSISMHAVITQKQDEIVLFVPYYPEYKVFAECAGGKAVPVAFDEKTYQIDFDKLQAVLNERTAAVIVNSPNNPSGIVYSAQTLRKIAEVLTAAEKKFGTTILLISDEPYREIVYDVQFESPLKYYDDSVLCYSYSKSFSLPGERIGYLAVSDKLQNADEFYYAVMGAGRALGYVCAPSLFQQVVAECTDTPTNTLPYRENRDRLTQLFTQMGLFVVNPQGAFYLLVKTPCTAQQFVEAAMPYGLLVVPTESFGLDGYVRVATCVSAEMIERSLPAWEKFQKEFLKKYL